MQFNTNIKRISVTGAAGRIAYSLLFRLANGELYGPHQPIALHLLEVPEALPILQGVVMELEDGAFPLLKQVTVGSNPKEIFENVETVFLIGSTPRKAGMERVDLIGQNGKIFAEQGKALGEVAAPNAIVLVVGNPANTNALIAEKHAKKHRFFAMTLLDEYRATSLLARKAGVEVTAISNMIIWGNHSSTLVPDFFNARIQGKPAIEVIADKTWLEEKFIHEVQKRGMAIIQACGKSSVASAAHAALGAMKSLIEPTPPGKWFSMGLNSDNNGYGIEQGIIFSFPCRSKGEGDLEIVQNIPWNEVIKKKITITEKELLHERELVKQLLKEVTS